VQIVNKTAFIIVDPTSGRN